MSELDDLAKELDLISQGKSMPRSGDEPLSADDYSTLETEARDIIDGNTALDKIARTQHLRTIIAKLREEYNAWS
ncbi:MAG: hypothetical protein QF400_04125 [Candidatus Peribacteraceae bacterium]|jgi:hypothetical protein|nr:hypothetical protein [Candidatus Peribacteraceae bacterium]